MLNGILNASNDGKRVFYDRTQITVISSTGGGGLYLLNDDVGGKNVLNKYARRVSDRPSVFRFDGRRGDGYVLSRMSYDGSAVLAVRACPNERREFIFESPVMFSIANNTRPPPQSRPAAFNNDVGNRRTVRSSTPVSVLVPSARPPYVKTPRYY